MPGIQVKYTCDSTIQPFDCYAVICVEEKGAPRVGYRLAVSRVWVAIELRLRVLGQKPATIDEPILAVEYIYIYLTDMMNFWLFGSIFQNKY